MKLIDADALKEAFFERGLGYQAIDEIIDEAPTIDAVPVVRCKNCKYLMFSDFYGECSKGYMGIVSPNDYCSKGEPKRCAWQK